MSINPVQTFGPANEVEFASAAQRPPAPTPKVSQAEETTAETSPNTESLSKQETRGSSTTTSSLELPQDEVQVQRDSQADGDIVVRYVDQSGNVILQVPSSQVLDLARAIDQDFQREAKLRSPEGTQQGQGGNIHGH